MKRLSLVFVFAPSILALGIATASASDSMASGSKHEADCQSKGMVKSHMETDPAARAKEHLSELKAKLNLTKEQEPALQAFSDQVNQQAKNTLSTHDMEDMKDMKDKPKSDTPKTAPERVAMMAEAMKTKAQSMAATAESVKTFYGALNTQQQAAFDKIQLSHMSSMHERMN